MVNVPAAADASGENKKLNTRIVLKHDTIGNWEKSALKLYEGEIALGFYEEAGLDSEPAVKKCEIRIGSGTVPADGDWSGGFSWKNARTLGRFEISADDVDGLDEKIHDVLTAAGEDGQSLLEQVITEWLEANPDKVGGGVVEYELVDGELVPVKYDEGETPKKSMIVSLENYNQLTDEQKAENNYVMTMGMFNLIDCGDAEVPPTEA